MIRPLHTFAWGLGAQDYTNVQQLSGLLANDDTNSQLSPIQMLMEVRDGGKI